MTKGEGLYKITSVPANTFIQFACADRQTNDDVPRGRNHLFTKHLLENITKENTDIRDIFRSVLGGVRRESNGKQEVLCMNGLQQEVKDVFLNEVKSMYELFYVSHHRTCSMRSSYINDFNIYTVDEHFSTTYIKMVEIQQLP